MTRASLLLLAALGCSSSDDAAPTPSVDASADVASSLDVATVDDTGPDTEAPDALEAPDVAVETDVAPTYRPLAMVYPANPLDTPDVVEVRLDHFPPQGAPGGVLTGDFANVRNCVANLETGKKVTVSLGGFSLDLTYCTPEHTALPGDDATYRHILPPAEAAIDSDPFAEVMMYHHVQRIHDYFQRGFGLTDLDYPFEALVNIQVAVSLCDGWAAFGNALFTPTGTFDYPVEFDFGLGGPAIIFGQTATKDFAYEADVISHEYTHAMIGATRLNAIVLDEQGLDNHAGALNEAYADYFACSLANESVIGNYALNAVEGFTVCGVPLSTSGNLARDLESTHRCPDDLTAEVHADAEIFSGALWAMRDLLGAERADALILNALVGFTGATDFATAAAATLAEVDGAVLDAAGGVTASEAAAIRAIFASRGVLDCQRVIPADKVGARLPISFESGGGIINWPFDDGTPGYVQVGVQVAPGVTEVALDLEVDGDPTLDALLKPGPDAVYFGEALTGPIPFTDATYQLPLERVAPGRFRLRVSGPCLTPGPWSVALLNRGGGFALRKAVVTTPETPGEPTLLCKEPVP